MCSIHLKRSTALVWSILRKVANVTFRFFLQKTLEMSTNDVKICLSMPSHTVKDDLQLCGCDMLDADFN